MRPEGLRLFPKHPRLFPELKGERSRHVIYASLLTNGGGIGSDTPKPNASPRAQPHQKAGIQRLVRSNFSGRWYPTAT